MSKRYLTPALIVIAVCAPIVLFLLAGSRWPSREKTPTAAKEPVARAPVPRRTENRPLQRVDDALRPAGSAAPDQAVPAPSGATSEAELMEELRRAPTPALAIALAREGSRRFPDSAFAPERESILIHSLADNEQRSEARGQAEYMVNHYPDSDWVREIERFTGARRHRRAYLTDAGTIELR